MTLLLTEHFVDAVLLAESAWYLYLDYLTVNNIVFEFFFTSPIQRCVEMQALRAMLVYINCCKNYNVAFAVYFSKVYSQKYVGQNDKKMKCILWIHLIFANRRIPWKGEVMYIIINRLLVSSVFVVNVTSTQTTTDWQYFVAAVVDAYWLKCRKFIWYFNVATTAWIILLLFPGWQETWNRNQANLHFTLNEIWSFILVEIAILYKVEIAILYKVCINWYLPLHFWGYSQWCRIR